MPFQAPSWTEFYACPICGNDFSVNQRLPISLGCGHTICRLCLATVYNSQCPFDQTTITTDVDNLPVNSALLQLFEPTNDTGDNDNHTCVAKFAATNCSKKINNNCNNNSGSGSGVAAENIHQIAPSVRKLRADDLKCYESSKRCIEELAQYLKSFFRNNGNLLTRPMLRKLVTLVNCQLMEEEGRVRAVRTARLLGERTVTELLLQHQNPQQLSLYLWAAVRSRGCQFLGPAMQEEVLKLVLQALENGSALSRKVLVMYVVQRLVENFLPASKTSIGHVVQLLYRASCFKVSKREGDSSLMQLKEEFRNYEALRREHDAQIVQIATEAGLRIAPDQWSSLLYGNTAHKSHMQSICDTLQSPSSFSQSVQELVLALQRTGDPTNLFSLRPHLKHLASIDPSMENAPPAWQDVENALAAVRHVVLGLVKFVQFHNNRKAQDYPASTPNNSGKYKISLCRDLTKKRVCPRGSNCTFAHSTEERQRYRAKNRRTGAGKGTGRMALEAGDTGHQSNVNAAEKEFQVSAANASPHHLKQTVHHTNTHTHQLPAASTTNVSLLYMNSDASTPSPAKVQSSPIRQYMSTNDDGTCELKSNGGGDGMVAAFGDSSIHSPLHVQGTFNMLRSSPLPLVRHMHDFSGTPHSGANLLNARPMPPSHCYDPNNVPFNATNNYSGRFVCLPAIVTPPNVMPSNVRGGAALVGMPPTLTAPASAATAINPPNMLNTSNTNMPGGSPHNNNNSNKSSLFTSPLSNDFYNMSGGGIGRNAAGIMHSPASSAASLFSNNVFDDANTSGAIDIQTIAGEFSLGFAKTPNTRTARSTNSTWDAAQHGFPSMLKPNDLMSTPLNSLLFDESNLTKGNNNNNNNRNNNNNNNAVSPADNQLLLWNNNSCHNNVEATAAAVTRSLAAAVNPAAAAAAAAILNENVMNIEASASSLFRDRESFVRSDSILDDDASTFDVPTTAVTLGNKYGPICPMYKGLVSATATASTTTTTNGINPTSVPSWDMRVHSGNRAVQNPLSSDINRSVFSMENIRNSDIGQKSLLQHHPLTVQASSGMDDMSTHLTHFDDNFDDSIQTALSKLSLNFNVVAANAAAANEQRSLAANLNNFKFDLNPLVNILGAKTFNAEDIEKTSAINDALIWKSPDRKQQQQQQTMDFNNFWNENITYPTNPSNLTLGSIANMQQQQRQQNQQQQQQQHHEHNHHYQQQQQHTNRLQLQQPHIQQNKRRLEPFEDNELDIADIVEKIWPCLDNNSSNNNRIE